ncbi:flavoprotein [Betaproteobacteria bacterium GR16-43]|nr:flavoprotein [Betaproteobacteria bacterium GR16-43]
MKSESSKRVVAVIGAGPVGLAAAAHLLERGLQPLVFEAGATIAGSLQDVRHVKLFSPWRYNMDAAALRLLSTTPWRAPALDDLPTAGEVIDHYLAPLAEHPSLSGAILLRHRVESLSRDGFDKVKTQGRDDAPFVIRAETPGGPREFRAWAVIDATGTWARPNPLGANGLPAIGERESAAHIAYGMPDVLGAMRKRYAGKRVLVAGAGHSAAGGLLALARLAEEEKGTRIAWTIRGHNFARIFGGGENDGLSARGALGQRLKRLSESGQLEVHADFRTSALRPSNGAITVEGLGPDGSTRTIEGIDEIIVATGGRPDLSIASELRLKLDAWLESTEALAPLIDPNVHSCGTVRPHGHRELAHPEVRYYAVGSKSYGRAPNFLLATGYEQVRSVAAALAGDFAAADLVQLELPQTGVCSTQFDEASSGCCSSGEPAAAEVELPVLASSSCCGGPPKAREDSCCAVDEVAKDAGKAGCATIGGGGCGTRKRESESA